MIDFETENGKGKFVLGGQDIIADSNFKGYVEKHGIEKAQGYLDAANDICRHLEDILGNYVGYGTVFTAYQVKTNTMLLYNCLHNFIDENSVKDQLIIRHPSNEP